MEKNRIRPITNGKGFRMSYSRQKEVLEMPNLIEVQKDSYQWFLNEGLREVFDDISPIEDYSGKLSLEFVDFKLCADDTKYSIEECVERDATYAAPLKVRVRLHNKENDEISEHEIFMGDLPLMTDTGTFVINGAERVIVSQLVRSPGIYYATAHRDPEPRRMAGVRDGFQRRVLRARRPYKEGACHRSCPCAWREHQCRDFRVLRRGAEDFGDPRERYGDELRGGSS